MGPFESNTALETIKIRRIQRVLERYPRLTHRLFCSHEIHYCNSQKRFPYQHYAARFAAKVAIRKLLGGGRLNEISVRRDSYGQTSVELKGRAEMLCRGHQIYLSLSHEGGLAAAYAREETDEFVTPTLILPDDAEPAWVADGDSVWFVNFRADRARELTAAFVHPDFDSFSRRSVPKLAHYVMLTEFSAELAQYATTAFPPATLTNTLGEAVANRGLSQLRIAETEKYAHVTFFFSGGREVPFEGETRTLIASPDVATYDLQPEMSAPELTERLTAAIRSGDFDLVICNYANPDMVGHSGIFEAAVAAVECVDRCLGEVVQAVEAAGGQCLVTADHGNVEKMDDPATGQPHTAHTTEPVPLVYLGDQPLTLEEGRLSDIAPTILDLMELPIPTEMTGRTLARRIRARAS